MYVHYHQDKGSTVCFTPGLPVLQSDWKSHSRSSSTRDPERNLLATVIERLNPWLEKDSGAPGVRAHQNRTRDSNITRTIVLNVLLLQLLVWSTRPSRVTDRSETFDK